MSSKKLLYVFTCAPYSNANGQEGLDSTLIGAAFDQKISVLFIYDGVFQIKEGQRSKNSGLKQVTKAFASLKDHGIENVYVHDASLAARGLTSKDLMIQSEQVTSSQITELIAQQYRVVTF